MTPQVVQCAQFRLAEYYLNRLRQAEKGARCGRENRAYWLDLIQHDWAQIKKWQAWAAGWTGAEPERARLCIGFPLAMSTLLRSRQTQSEFLEWAQSGLEAAESLGDHVAERRLLYQQAFVLLNMESLDAVDRCAQQLFEHAKSARDDLALGQACYLLGAVHVYRGAYDSAEILLSKSISYLEAYPAEEAYSRVWTHLGSIAFFRGEYQLAYTYFLKHLEIETTADRVGAVSGAHVSISSVLIHLRQYDAAELHAQQAAAICRRHGFVRGLQPALLSLAHAEKWLGKLDSACLRYEEVLAKSDLLPPSLLASCYHGLGQTRFRQGDLERALAHFGRALQLAREGRILFRLCDVLPDMIVLHLARHELEAAQARLYDLITAAQQLGTQLFMARALAAAVILWRRCGKFEQAAEWAGLLTNYPQHLDPFLFPSTIFERLEIELGPQRYHEALEKGKILTLVDVLDDIANSRSICL